MQYWKKQPAGMSVLPPSSPADKGDLEPFPLSGPHAAHPAPLASSGLGMKGGLPRYEHPFYRVTKRVFDFTLALVGLVLLSPLFLVLVIAISAIDGFPVIFRQKRLGQGGREFWIFKFRTMKKDAEEILKRDPALMEEYKRNYKLANDPRLLPGGNWMRKTSLDELPQLINVLKGDMSLVGPRPILKEELAKYGTHDDLYLAMKPGCAGLWQCSGRSDLTYDERVLLDARYYKTASLRKDVLILARTLKTIVSRRGAV
jgi:exopolysaccharide production protein ExoY